MTKKNEVQEVEKQGIESPESAEPTRDRLLFIPPADIYESEEAIHVAASMAGVDENSVDITLEKRLLTLRGHVAPQVPENMTLMYREYATGDFERSFTLSEEIDRSGIEATVKDGVLKLTLPKCREAQSRRIDVKAR